MKPVRRRINKLRFGRAVQDLSDTKIMLLLGQARERSWTLLARDVPGGPAEVWQCGRRRFEIYDREAARAWR